MRGFQRLMAIVSYLEPVSAGQVLPDLSKIKFILGLEWISYFELKISLKIKNKSRGDNMKKQRRDLLRISSALGLALAAGILKPSEVFAAGWDPKLFDTKTVKEALLALGGDGFSTSDAVMLSGPEMVASGSVVPLSIESKIPNTDFMAVLVQKNPLPMTAVFNIPPGTDAMISTRIKMGETSTIYGLVRAEGKYYVGSTMIKVRAGGGGCG
jgi:sulfur-oxidizing protein SoxY